MLRYYVPGPQTGAPILVTDTITILKPENAGAVVVSGSHGGTSSGRFSLQMPLAGVFFNDAGIGKDDAGIRSLSENDVVGLPTVTVSHSSAEIGSGPDTWGNGVVSRANAAAIAIGVAQGMTVSAAASILALAKKIPQTPAGAEPPTLWRGTEDIDGRQIVLMESISMLKPDDAGKLVISGSHGGAVSAEFVRRHHPRLAVFSDAGMGRNKAGIASLAELDATGIAVVAVSHLSARIGEPKDVLHSGVISAANAPARALGFAVGVPLLHALGLFDT